MNFEMNNKNMLYLRTKNDKISIIKVKLTYKYFIGTYVRKNLKLPTETQKISILKTGRDASKNLSCEVSYIL